MGSAQVLLADMARLVIQYSSLEQALLWAMVVGTSIAVVLSSIRWRRPMPWIVSGAVCLFLTLVLSNVGASSFTPLPPGPPGRVISVSEPWLRLLFAISTFLAVVGVVAFLCGLVCLLSSRRRRAARS